MKSESLGGYAYGMWPVAIFNFFPKLKDFFCKTQDIFLLKKNFNYLTYHRRVWYMIKPSLNLMDDANHEINH